MTRADLRRGYRLLRAGALGATRWQFPDWMSRRSAIQCAIDALGARTYLEIGVDQGQIFTAIEAEQKIGVDPVAQAPAVARISGDHGVWYYQMASDEFFAGVAPTRLADGIDVAFVDGLHTWQQAYRDCLNALEYLSPGGVILVHDCLPRNASEARVAGSIEEARRLNGPNWDGNWTGDVWKTIVMLRAAHSDLQVDVLNTDHGVGILRRGRNGASLGLDRAGVEQLRFDDLQRDAVGLLGLRTPASLWKMLAELRAGRRKHRTPFRGRVPNA